MDEVFLRSEHLNKYFGITHAIKDVSLEFKAGEIHGLIGENGSGKSTFCSMLCGIYPRSGGDFYLEGKKLDINSQVDAAKCKISMIVQEIGTLSGLTVAENLFLGREKPFMKGIFKKSKQMVRAAQKILDGYGYPRIKASELIDHYSFEDRKIIEIVKAVYDKPKVLVVDETTTALSRAGRENLFKIMDQIKESGSTVIFISHDLAEVLERTDRVTILRDGVRVSTVETSSVNADDLKRMMVGRELKGKYYRTDYGAKVDGEVVLSVKNLSVEGKLDDVSFDLHKGEILGFGGLSECGMHELGKAIFGASHNRKGSVAKGGVEIDNVRRAIKNKIAYASKDRDNESIVASDTIKSNIVLPSLDDLSHKGLLRDKELVAFAQKYADLMSTKMTGIGQSVSELSGGNKQKIVLSRWIGQNSDVFVLDSPTRGIDVQVKANIYNLMEDLKSRGKSIIMISEELPELLGMSDRIVILKNGRVSGEFARSEDLCEEDIISSMV